MKTSVRFLSMLLAVLMIAGAALTASAGTAETTANEEALQLLVDLGVFGGYDDGSLKPNNLVERDEMAKIIFVLYTTFQDAGEGKASFSDVAADNWAAGYITWCSSKGIVGGYGDGTFGPDDNVTYDQALKMVCGALGYNEWDSKLWPTDVRLKALRELNLGENVSVAKGTDYVTRAQIAQIVYNALFADMNETKTVNIPFNGYEIPVEVAKTLAVDTWSFGQVVTTITEVESDLLPEDTDVYLDGIGAFSYEELGLEAYAKDPSDLVFATVTLAYNTKEVADPANLKAEDIIASSVTINSVEDVEIVFDDKKSVVLVGGVEADEDAMAVISDKGQVNNAPLISDTVPAEGAPYFSRAYDFDKDGKYELVYWSYDFAVEVTNLTEKKISLEIYGTGSVANFDLEELTLAAALEEEDVAVITFDICEIKLSAPIEAVTAKATKYNGTKLTLDGVGEVAINEPVFAFNPVFPVDKTVMNVNDKGETTPFVYYIYDGKVFGADIVVDESELAFAVLSYINAPSEAVFDPVTMDFDTSYTALITINGKEQTVNVNARDTIDGLNMIDNADQILDLYGKKFTNDGINPVEEGVLGKYILGNYTLVTYTVDEDGYYTFTTTHTSDEDYNVYAADSTLEYNKKIGLFTLKAADGSVISDRVVIDPAAAIYYTYQKETTGHHVHLGSYTASTLPADLAKATITSEAFATVDEETGFINLKVAVLDEASMEFVKEEVADFRTDSRQIFYCYQGSNEAMAADSKSLNYTYFFRPIHNGTNLAEQTNTELTADKGATKASRGFLYAWDEETKNYVKISKSTLEQLGVTSIGIYTLEDYINGCIITEAGSKYEDGVKIDPTAHIWALGGDETKFVTLTPDTLQTSLNIAEEGGYTTSVIIGTHLDENGEEVVSTVIVQQYVYNSSGNPAPNSQALMNNFKG